MLPQQKDRIRPGLGQVKDQEKRCGKWKDKRPGRRQEREREERSGSQGEVVTAVRED